MNTEIRRRRFLLGAIAAAVSASCTDPDQEGSSSATGQTGVSADAGGDIEFSMPAEGTERERTWMCWPSNRDVWGDDLEAVQDTIAEIALTIAEFEPVTMLCRPDQLDALGARTGGAIELLAAPVDDLWARDTLPCFVTGIDQNGSVALAAARFRFNG